MKVKHFLSTLLLGYSWVGFTQTTKPEPIFGSVVERKVQKDSTKKRHHFNPLKPAFLRLGVMGGGLLGFENTTADNVGGTSGMRLEYGFSNRWSLVGEVSGNYFEGITFSTGQASGGVNWMPYKSKRLQPFFGIGGGAGGDGFRGGRYGRNGRYGFGKWFEKTDSTSDKNQNIQGFAYARMGLNYVLFKRIIATAETTYQLPFNNSSSSGGLALRVGASYQFGNFGKRKGNGKGKRR
jgi:hypothetical protein